MKFKEFVSYDEVKRKGRCPECSSSYPPRLVASFTTKYAQFFICRECHSVFGVGVHEVTGELVLIKLHKGFLPKSARFFALKEE